MAGELDVDPGQVRRLVGEQRRTTWRLGCVPCLETTGRPSHRASLLPTVRDQLAADGPVALSALALAGWCLYLRGGPNARSEPIEVAGDPNRQEVMARATRSLTDPASFLGYEPVFGSDLGSNASLVPAFVAALGSLERTGVVPSITDALGVEERKMGRDPRAP